MKKWGAGGAGGMDEELGAGGGAGVMAGEGGLLPLLVGHQGGCGRGLLLILVHP